jgi:hypothetical protein
MNIDPSNRTQFDDPETTIAAPKGTAIDLLPHMVDEAPESYLRESKLSTFFASTSTEVMCS